MFPSWLTRWLTPAHTLERWWAHYGSIVDHDQQMEIVVAVALHNAGMGL